MREMRDVSDPSQCPADNGQIGIIDLNYRARGFQVYDGLFKHI
jgi:hypothetical protein